MNSFLEEYGEFIIVCLFAAPIIGAFVYFMKYILGYL